MEGMCATFFFSRAWIQWYGGLGFALISLALVIGPGLSAKRLAGDEVVVLTVASQLPALQERWESRRAEE